MDRFKEPSFDTKNTFQLSCPASCKAHAPICFAFVSTIMFFKHHTQKEQYLSLELPAMRSVRQALFVYCKNIENMSGLSGWRVIYETKLTVENARYSKRSHQQVCVCVCSMWVHLNLPSFVEKVYWNLCFLKKTKKLAVI